MYYMYTNLTVNAIVRLHHPRNGENQETSLAPSADNQTRNYDAEYPNNHPSLSTLKVKGIEMVSYIYTNLTVNSRVRLSHPRSGDSQG